MRSIRAQLLQRLLTGTFAILLAGSAVLGLAIHDRLMAEFDGRLVTKAKALAVLTSLEGRRIEFEPDGPEASSLRMNEEGDLYQLQLHDGTVFACSEALRGRGLPVSAGPVLDEPDFRSVRLADGLRRRMVSFTFLPRTEPENPLESWPVELPSGMEREDVRVAVAVAGDVRPVRLLILSLCVVLAGVDLIVLACIAWLAWNAVRDGLRPLDSLNEQIGALDGSDASRTVEVAAPPTELQPVIEALNGLLNRQRLALEQERQFASDASHELRTPVAELRALCEVGARWPDDSRMTQSFFQDVGEIAGQMQQTVGNLLTLSRCASGSLEARSEDIRLRDAVQEAWRRVEDRAAARGLALHLDIAAGVRVRCDRGMLDMILQNLLENAVSHGDAGGSIVCAATRDPAGAVLSISNPASTLSPEDLPRVFDRFWRKSAARSDREHAGLGLAIVKGLCEFLRMGVRMDMPSPGTVRVRMVLPGAMASAPFPRPAS